METETFTETQMRELNYLNPIRWTKRDQRIYAMQRERMWARRAAAELDED